MQSRFQLLLVAFLAITFTFPAAAQFLTEGVKGGFAGGGMVGFDKETKNNFLFQGRGFLRYDLTDYLQGEVGGGYGEISGKTPAYRTTLIPADVRLLLSPLSEEKWNPYIYAGIGGLYYEVKNYLSQSTPGHVATAVADPAKLKGWQGYMPAGVGLQFLVSSTFTLEASAGFNYTPNDDINGMRKRGDKTRDNFLSYLVGFMWSGPSGYADSDGDGLINKLERDLGTNPDNLDSDNDGLTDGEEYFTYKTDPLEADSDGDSLTDSDEVKIYGTEPNKKDSDRDELADNAELQQYKTDPLKRDTDVDGLRDNDEVMNHKTDPLKPDTDGDNLSDYDEVMKYKTNPLLADTDGGTVNDDVEIARGSNPLDSFDDVPKVAEIIKVEKGKAIVLEGITFKSGSAEITPESYEILEKVYNTLLDNMEIEVEIQGHTDNTGKRSANMKLSQRRADAVKTYLAEKGIEAKRIKTKGYGPDMPIADNATPEGRAKNRRIEFLRLK